MRFFRRLYESTLAWSAKPRASIYLCVLSFIEAFIFPVPPEVMMTPMALSRPEKAFRYAHLCLAFSITGALVGYVLGHYVFEAMMPLLEHLHLLEPIKQTVEHLQTTIKLHWWSMIFVLLLAALQPVIPMKLVTWSSGIVGIPLPLFILCMAVGRGKRVYLLAALVRWFGPRAEQIIHRHIERLGWIFLGIFAVIGLGWLVIH